MEYLQIEKLLNFTIFSDDYLYKKYLVGFSIFNHNSRYIDAVCEYRYYVLSHNRLYCIKIEYNDNGREAWLSGLTLEEMKKKLPYRKKDTCAAENPRRGFAIVENLEMTTEQFHDLLNHPEHYEIEDDEIRSKIRYAVDSQLRHNGFSDYINSILTITRAH